MIELWFLCTALPLIALYQCVKFHLNPFSTFEVMRCTKKKCERWTDRRTDRRPDRRTDGPMDEAITICLPSGA